VHRETTAAVSYFSKEFFFLSRDFFVFFFVGLVRRLFAI